jgi:alpha-glucosidase
MHVARSRLLRAAAAAACTVAVLAPLRAQAASSSAHPAASRTWRLDGPTSAADAVTARVALTRDGGLTLTAARGGTTVLRPSTLGIRTADADFTTGLRYTGERDERIHETYTTVIGARTHHTEDARQSTFTFTKAGHTMRLAVRVSADGVAYRYLVPGPPETVTVLGEASEYSVPASADSFLLPWDNGRSDYEGMHVHTTVAQAAPADYGYPSLFHVGDSWMLLGETGVDGHYGGSRLTLSAPADATEARFHLTLPDPAEVSSGGLATPWRTIQIGDLATIAESDMTTDLAAPSQVADTSWIKPGKAAWSWWSEGTGDLALQKKYVDFVARQGWQYVLVDSGWSADWMPELCQYARSKGVGVWLWDDWQHLDQQSERDRSLPLWKSWGIAGVKIDFLESDGQDRMRWMDAVLKDTAKYRLMVNFHGAPLPRGQERTWPQVMSFEAVHGAEGTKPKPGRVPYPAWYYTTLPFTRNLAGPMDFTPVTFSGVRPTSDAAELALSVVYQSGVQHFADSVASYDRHPAAERFLRGVPTVWDETRLVDGDPADRAVFARRSDDDWYLGAITAGAARTLHEPLTFLGPGDWLMDLYSDGPDGISVGTRQVTSATGLSVDIPENGGYAARFCPAAPGRTTCGE